MGKPPEDLNRSDPQGIWGAGNSAIPETWSKAITELVNSESSFEASARALDSYLTMTASAHKLLTQFMGQILGQLNMPTQSEIISVAERLTNIEMRLDDLDARLDDIVHAIETVANAVSPVLVASGAGGFATQEAATASNRQGATHDKQTGSPRTRSQSGSHAVADTSAPPRGTGRGTRALRKQ